MEIVSLHVWCNKLEFCKKVCKKYIHVIYMKILNLKFVKFLSIKSYLLFLANNPFISS